MKYITITAALLLTSHLHYSQVVMQPKFIYPIQQSVEGEKEFKKNIEESKKNSIKPADGKNNEDPAPKNGNPHKHAESNTPESYWNILGPGCSWYCGGGPKEVSASSYLKSQGSITYVAKNAHDLNYKNAWAEGAKDYGVGEYLLYTFSASSPRVTEIIVVNGYVKSQSDWENNSRVKKLKVYYNDEPIAILNLKDVRARQGFKFEPLGYNNRENTTELKAKPDWTLKFEILEVYEGLKFDNTVISEIYFNGIDVH